MNSLRYPKLEIDTFTETRNALHSYAKVLGNWLKLVRLKRKHWWHASLRPSITGLTSRSIRANLDFELQLNLQRSQLQIQTTASDPVFILLEGQSGNALIEEIGDHLASAGLDSQFILNQQEDEAFNKTFGGYQADQAATLHQTLASVTAAMEVLRGSIKEETSPIQLWPHHFDLSMIWLPGEKIPGQDPENEEYSDKQMNFGFTFGDGGIPEPYFYITAYPLPETMPATPLPRGTVWQTEGFNGAVLLYRTLIEEEDPQAYLLDLWTTLLDAGHKLMLTENS